MRELAGAVTIVSCGQGARRAGFAATSVASLSLEPPTLIVCANRASSTWPTLRAATSFGLNVLSASHRDLAHRFAGRTGAEGSARYEAGEWTTLRAGAPASGRSSTGAAATTSSAGRKKNCRARSA
jgi:3-hydroxy-9,10-secoandrosta-1,3,5(10)-triene-9,17-dione monooxygenase reductase component